MPRSALNLNTFTNRSFDNPPRRLTGARFRRHPFKIGNMTATLSNYDVLSGSKSNRRWRVSIQYGTGPGFGFQEFPDDIFKEIEPVISALEGGPMFVHLMNNGFTEKIASSSVLQQMFETGIVDDGLVEPAALVDHVRDIIDEIIEPNSDSEQLSLSIFNKHQIPRKQVMAVYALSIICSVANGGNQ